MKYYTLLLAFHLISITVWISALIQMQRLIFLQAGSTSQQLLKEGFFIYKRLANPSLLLTIVLGVILISLNKNLLETGIWIYLKFFIISLLIIIHHLCKINFKQLEKNLLITKKQTINYHSYAPLVLLCIVILLTVTKPF